MTKNGDLDYDELQATLMENAHRNSLKVCSLSAGSNLTGTLFDVDRIAVMSHNAGFLSCFDYAATCPYVDINVNGLTHSPFKSLSTEDAKLAYKDAIFLSPHKLVGGP